MDLGPNSPYELNTPILGTSFHAQDISVMATWGNTDKTADFIDVTKPGAKEYIQSYADLVASWGVDADAADWKAIANGWRIDGDIEAAGGPGMLTGWNGVARRFVDAAK